ncbi:MAG: CapA family protein [Actinomycetota bacterium]
MRKQFMSIALLVAVGAAMAAPAGSFGDVEDDAWYAPAVAWMVEQGLTNGTSPGCFEPDLVISRAEVAAFFHRLEDEPAPSRPAPFDDVDIPWAADAIAWMAEVGITSGTSPTTFDPRGAVTRGQFAAFLHRYEGSPWAPPHRFTDVVAHYQQAPVAWLATTGITTGTSPSTFAPDRPLTRAELAVFLHRHAGSPVAAPLTEASCERPLTIHAVGDVNFDPGYGPNPRHPYAYAWEGLDGLFLRDDLSIINLECAPSEIGRRVPKTYTFRCPVDSLVASAAAGVDVANLANNHGGDYGIPALLDGAGNVAATGIAPVGVGIDLEAALTPALFEINGTTIAVLGFNTVGARWDAGPAAAGMAPGDPATIAAAVTAADAVADFVFVTIHWGIELASTPAPDDLERARAAIDAGADAVFGHHPHVLQPLETYRDRPIFWSLGNFVWHAGTQTTAVARVIIETDGSITATLVPARIEEKGHPVLVG